MAFRQGGIVPRKATSGRYILHPAARYKDKIRLVQGRDKRVPNRWEAQFITDAGKWGQPVSLKTDDFEDAKHEAVSKYERAVAGAPLTSRVRHTFKAVAEKTIARLEGDRAMLPEHKRHTISQKIGRIKRNLIPQWGDHDVSKITPDDLARWTRGLRVRDRTKGSPERKPAKSTIGNLNGAWREVMIDAQSLGWITIAQTVGIDTSEFKKGEREPTFTEDEIRLLRAHMTDAWIAKPRKKVSQQNRYLARAMAALMTTTGIRPGNEVEQLTPGQIDFFAKDSRGAPAVEITIRRNQGKHHTKRETWINRLDVWSEAEQLMRDLIGWQLDNATPEGERRNPHGLIFARPIDGRIPGFGRIFRAVFEELNIRTEPKSGHERKPVSFRHYYATQALYRGVNVALLVAQMGTSLQMIDQHYGHVLLALKSHEMTGSHDLSKRGMRELRDRLRAQQREERPDWVDELETEDQ